MEVLRILMSIGPTETMHFQTWSDKAGNAPPLTAVDPVTGVSVTFPDLDVTNELFKKNLIMPEPCPFLDRRLPIVSIIRPTNTEGAATGALTFLTNMGLFIGQSQAFFAYLSQLAQDADRATRGAWLSGNGTARLAIEPKSASGRTRNATARRLMRFWPRGCARGDDFPLSPTRFSRKDGVW